MEDRFKAFEKEITDAANRLSIDAEVGMHDFVIAEFMINALKNFVKTVKRESELSLPSHPIS